MPRKMEPNSVGSLFGKGGTNGTNSGANPVKTPHDSNCTILKSIDIKNHPVQEYSLYKMYKM